MVRTEGKKENMVRASTKNGESKVSRKTKKSRSSGNKYLKPGDLAKLRDTKASAARCYLDKEQKCIPEMGGKIGNCDLPVEAMAFNKSPLILSPVSIFKENALIRTPKTPQADPYDSESRLESLPMDILVKILCELRHDQLKAAFLVSQRIRRAALLAKQYHFNYTTPDCSGQETLSFNTPRSTDHWTLMRRGKARRTFKPHPQTPKAPRHGPRPPSRIKLTEMKQVAAALFQDQTFPSTCKVPSIIKKPLFKPLASNRVLFYEDELCQAVAQNKLL